MNQKRFLTILPIIFIVIVTILLLIAYFTTRDEENDPDVLGVSCIETFQDQGLGIDFDYPCEWELSLETTLGDDFLYNAENRYGYVAEKYFIRFKDEDQLVQIRVVLADTQGSMLSMENKYEYEVFNNELVRFSREDEIYKYGKYISCSDLQPNQIAGEISGEDCSRTMVFGISDQFPSIVEVFNPSDLDLVDDFVLSISE